MARRRQRFDTPRETLPASPAMRQESGRAERGFAVGHCRPFLCNHCEDQIGKGFTHEREGEQWCEQCVRIDIGFLVNRAKSAKDKMSFFGVKSGRV